MQWLVSWAVKTVVCCLQTFTRTSPMNLADHTLRSFCLESRGDGRSADDLRGRVTLETRFEEQDYWKGVYSGQQKPTWLVPY